MRSGAPPPARSSRGSGVRAEVLERLIEPAEIGHVGARHRKAAGLDLRHPLLHGHEPIGLGERERLQQHRVDDAEHRRRGADAEREGEHGDRGERRRAPQHAPAVPHVLPQHLEAGARADVTHFFLDLFRAAELHEGLPPRVIGRGAALDLLVDEHRERRLHLVVEVRVDAAAPEQVADEGANAGEPAGHVSATPARARSRARSVPSAWSWRRAARGPRASACRTSPAGDFPIHPTTR